MLLNEFFGKAIDISKESSKNSDDKEMHDDLFWYILDHDKLHKDYFLPLAKKMKQRSVKEELDKEQCVMEFLPMVQKGCMEYYQHKKMKGRPEKVFPKDLQKEICEKLFDHFREDVVKDKYKLGR
jgi:hypothetical protein